MKLAIITLAAGAVTLGLAATTAIAATKTVATPAGTPLASGQCFRSSEIRSHVFADSSTMLIDVRGREVYRVGVSGRCFAGASRSDPIVTRTPPGSQMICKPIDLDLAVSAAGGPAIPCIVNSITKLSPDEVATLPKKLKP